MRSCVIAAALGLLATQLGAQDLRREDSLAEFLEGISARIPRAASLEVPSPSPPELEEFVAFFGAMLELDIDRAAGLAEGVGYELAVLDDARRQAGYLVATERGPDLRGQGTFVVSLDWRRNLIVSVPHPLSDVGTLEEGRSVFEDLGARVLCVGGSHRSASSVLSPCTQTQMENRDGGYKVSDTVHSTQNYTFSAHRAAFALDDPPYVIDLHRNTTESYEVVLSNGVTRKDDGETKVLELRKLLRESGVRAVSCNFAGDSGLNLCGTKNVVGRLLNGSPDPCETAADRASGRFLHVEQSKEIVERPRRLITALAAVFPAEPATPEAVKAAEPRR